MQIGFLMLQYTTQIRVSHGFVILSYKGVLKLNKMSHRAVVPETLRRSGDDSPIRMVIYFGLLFGLWVCMMAHLVRTNALYEGLLFGLGKGLEDGGSTVR